MNENVVTIDEIFGMEGSVNEQLSRESLYGLFGTSYHHRLERGFSELGGGEQQSVFAVVVISRLARIGKLMVERGLLPESNGYQEALLEYIEDKAHGVAHSFDVYEAAKLHRDEGGHRATDSDLWVRAVLHDFGEFLPTYRLDGTQRVELSEPESFEQKRKHDKVIGYAVLQIGRALGVGNMKQLATDLLYHDVFWTRPSLQKMEYLHSRMSEAGQIIADVDRIGSLEMRQLDLAREALEAPIMRNRKFSLGRWYFLRTDLTASERNSWQMRTKGLYDGASALQIEFFGDKDWMFTSRGKELYEQRKDSFILQLDDFYKTQYDLHWFELENAINENYSIEFGLRGNGDALEHSVSKIAQPKFHRYQSKNSRISNLKKLIRLPVDELSSEDRQYYGYSVRIDDGKGNVKWLDPSIMVYSTYDDFKDLLHNVFGKSSRKV